MAPSGLIISKLGIQGTASDTHVKGLLCLKISLPKESPGRPGARWTLFNSNPPRLLSQPTIHPLPLPLPSASSGPLRIATALLALPAPTSYPPSSPSGLGGKPYIDVSSTTGKVFVVVDQISGGRRGSFKSGGSGGRDPGGHNRGGEGGKDRREWLIVMEYEVPVEDILEQSIKKTLFPLPRCLDNAVRLVIQSPSTSTSALDEVSVLTEPKLLSVPSGSFSTSLPRRRKRLAKPGGLETRQNGKTRGGLGAEEGWEDGEDLGPDDISEDGSEEEWSDTEDDEDEDGTSILSGRFQSTDTLRVEWSFTSPMGTVEVPSLEITPQWDRRAPSIQLDYSAPAPGRDTVVPLEVDAPDGWAWSELFIEGDGLAYWRSVDSDSWDSRDEAVDPDATIELYQEEDSFATVRPGKKPRQPLQPLGASPRSALSGTGHPQQPALMGGSSASLMRQTLPAPADMNIDDYSFELSGEQSPARLRPATPSGVRRSPTLSSSPTPSRGKALNAPVLREPRVSRLFDLYFSEGGERGIVLQGTLVPLSPLTLVSAHLPCRLPLVTFCSPSSSTTPQQCHVQCPSARYGKDSSTPPTSEPTLIDVTLGGTFTWINERSSSVSASIRDKEVSRVRGSVKTRLRRNAWGVVSMSVIFPFPRRAEETGFSLYSHGSLAGEVRITRATVDGVPASRCLYTWEGEGEGEESTGRTEVRVGKKGREGGLVEIVLEMSGETVGMPVFEGSVGTGSVELVGDGWEALIKAGLKTTLTPAASPNSFTYDLSSPHPTITLVPPPIATAPASTSRFPGLFTPFTVWNLILLWILLSVGLNVRKLTGEVAYVREEARDLRLYGIGGRGLPEGRSHMGSGEEGSWINPDSAVGQQTPVVSYEPAPADTTAPSVPDHAPALPKTRSAVADWEKWAHHPTVQSLSRSVSWLWHAVVWLFIPA
ncbi:hypothetical protein IAT38_002128 [Cryptococcus sp. DSM 104549]